MQRQECPICYEDIVAADTVGKLGCGRSKTILLFTELRLTFIDHIFCGECLITSLIYDMTSRRQERCPMCRHVINITEEPEITFFGADMQAYNTSSAQSEHDRMLEEL